MQKSFRKSWFGFQFPILVSEVQAKMFIKKRAIQNGNPKTYTSKKRG